MNDVANKSGHKMELRKLWTSDIKNRIYGGFLPVLDPFDQDYFYVGDGLDSTYSSMKLRKFIFRSGQEIQSVYIKNNVRCLKFHINQSDLFAITDNKIIQIDRKTFDVKAKFDQGIQRYNDYVESNDTDTLLMMNQRRGFLFIFDYKTGMSRKKKIGSCCGIFKKADHEYYIFDGHEGKILIYDTLRDSVKAIIETDVFHSAKLQDNHIAILRLGHKEYHATNGWQVKPTDKIRMIDLTSLTGVCDIDTGINFLLFKADKEIIYLWNQHQLWCFSVNSKSIISEDSIDPSEYIMGVFPQEGKLLTENIVGKGEKSICCYEFKI